ncbi:MAG TPA: TIGR04211 family SH3 domain-containing protein [Desulfomonilia bacterium]|nr:TIGR04211 family SH3 domain-containing protein [Desulfomonilia bacterium]
MNKGVVGLAALICTILILVPPVYLNAKGMYVRDWIVITLRSTPNESSQAVGTANTNDLVEVLEEQGDGWSRIRNKDGIEGWVPGRFLSAQPPKTFFVKQMEDRIRALQDENMRLKGLTSARTTGGVASPGGMQHGNFIPPGIAFSDCTGLKQGYDKLLHDSQDCSKKIEVLTSENSRLKTSDRLIFTFIGGLFIVFGIVIGLFIEMVRGRPKKQGYRF